MTSMDIFFLGTGSAYPTPVRGSSCLVLRNDGDCWLFDCGEGSQTQLMKSQVKPGKISKIFISHLHGDHVFGLPGLLCTLSMNNRPKTLMEIYGPQGLRKFLRTTLELSWTLLEFEFVVHELKILDFQLSQCSKQLNINLSTSDEILHPNEQLGKMILPDSNQIFQLFEDEKQIVKSVALKHTVPSFGFVIEEKTLLKKLNADILKKKNISPGPEYGKLKAGQSIVSPSGEIINPDDVLKTVPGRKIVIGGDSCDSSELLKIGQNCDLFVHEATLSDEMKEQAEQNGHSTPSETVKLAIDMKAEHLVLTHVSQRYKPFEKDLQVSTEEESKKDSVIKLLDEAQQTAKEIGSKILIDMAEDFAVFSVKYKQVQ